MGKVNELVLCRDDYEDEFGFQKAIQDAVMLLLNAGYIMTINYDEPIIGIVVIQYEYADQGYGCRYPYWLSPEEFESVVFEDEE